MSEPTNRLDYVLKGGSRGVWEYEFNAESQVPLSETFKYARAYLTCRGQDLDHMVIVEISEKDVQVFKY